MFNFFRNRKPAMYKVTYKLDGGNMIYITTTSSEGLARLESNLAVEFIKVVKLRAWLPILKLDK